MNLTELKRIIDDVTVMVDDAGVDFKNVTIKFKTFDDRFEENADEYQEPDQITAVDVDILSWKTVTITIERKVQNERMEALNNVIDK